MLFDNDCSHLPLKRTASDPNLPVNEQTEKLDQLIISIANKLAPEKNGLCALLEKSKANTRITTSHHCQALPYDTVTLL